MKLQNGDAVVVISGKDKGKTGSIMKVLPNKGRVVVSGINMRTKHMKATPQRAGQKITYEASLDVSNVMILDPKTKKRARIGSAVSDKGRKQRIARQSGEVIAKTALATPKKVEEKAEKKTTKTTAKKTAEKATPKKVEEKEEKKTPEAAEKAAAPVKKPFWKKMVNFGDDVDADGEGGGKTNEDNSQQSSSATRTTSRGS